MTAVRRCAFAAVRWAEGSTHEWIDYATLANAPDRAEALARNEDRTSTFGAEFPFNRIAEVVIEERHDPFHDLLRRVRAVFTAEPTP